MIVGERVLLLGGLGFERRGAAEGALAAIVEIEEAVFVGVLAVDVTHIHGADGDDVVTDKDEDGLFGFERGDSLTDFTDEATDRDIAG